MKVLQIITDLGKGGAESLVFNLLKENNNHEIQIDVLLLNPATVYNIAEIKSANVFVSPIKDPRSLKQVKFIRQILKQNYYDVVHVHLFPPLYFAALAKRSSINKNVKFVFTEHNTSNRRRKWYFKLIDNWFYAKYDKIIAISEGVNKSLEKWLSKRNYKKVITIHNGVRLERFRLALSYNKSELSSKFKDNDILILFAARFDKQKDQKTVVKALQSLPENYKLMFVGDGPLKGSIMDLVSELNLEKRVEFLGFRSDIDRINKTADIIVVSSFWEGFGLVALEGMAAEKPILATNVEGLKEVINDRERLFEVGDHVSLSEKIQNIKIFKVTYDIAKYDFSFFFQKHLAFYRAIVRDAKQ